MKVLCSSPPMDGVFNPFVPMGRALLAAGHEVLVATGADLQAQVAGQGFAAAVAGPTAMEGAISAMADPAAGVAPDDWQFAGTMFGAVIAQAKIGALRQLADEYRPDLVVHPPVDLAAPLLAAERVLPSAAYGFSQLPGQPFVAALAERVAPLWRQSGLPPDPFAGIYRGHYLDPCPPALQNDRPPAGALVQPIRPEIPGDPRDGLPGWAGSLGERPVIYLSLGTVPFFNQPAKFAMMLADLGAEDVDVVVTMGALNDPASLGFQPGNVHVERWLPLAPLLPRCDAVVCHGGSGTTLAALAAGLPLVLVPQGADQFINAAACRRAGLARVLDQEAVSSAAVRDAVLAILPADAPERAAAREVAAQIAAMPSAAEVADGLRTLARR